MYKLNTGFAGRCYAFPCEIADKHMKLASAASFKVLLFLLSGEEGAGDLAAIAQGTALSPEACEDALDYWVRLGILTDGNAVARPERKKEEQIQRDIRPLPVRKPTAGEIAKRISQNSDLAAMYNEAQRILGLTFGYDMQGILLMIHDHYGFSPETVLLLLQHCRMTSGASAAAVKNLAQDWAKKGITSFFDAEAEIVKLNRAQEEADKTIKQLGLPAHKLNDSERKHYYTWVNTYGYTSEVIAQAFTLVAGSSPETAALTAVGKELRRWREKGVDSPQEAKALLPKKSPKKETLPPEQDKMRRSRKLDMFAEPDEEEDE